MFDYSERLDPLPFGLLWRDLPHHQTVNPFVFEERMALYKQLMDAMNTSGAFGKHNEYNNFWGFVSQLFWQWRSGRLQGNAKEGEIAPDSWWGNINYALSVIPYLAAVEEGIAPQIEIRPRTQVGDKPFDKALQKWRDFFREVKTLKLGDDLEPTRFLAWAAHLESILTALPLYKDNLAQVSKPEQTFATGWVRMVDFLGTAAWRTDLDFLRQYGLGDLPPRLLTGSDVPGQISDMSEAVNGTLLSVFGLSKLSKPRMAFNLWLWKRAMRTREARDDAPRLLVATFSNAPELAKDKKRITRYILALRTN